MLQIDTDHDYYHFRDHRRHYDLSLGKLSQIIDAMEELLVLKNQYNLHVNFEEYFEVSLVTSISLVHFIDKISCSYL